MGGFDDLVTHITNGTTFTASCENFGDSLSASLIIITIMMCFMLVAAFAKLCCDGSEYAKKYDEAWDAMPGLATSMVGITCLTPVIQVILQPIISPVYEVFGAHAAMFAGTLLAPDMGGWPLGETLSNGDYAAAMYSGILGSSLGATIVFNIPYGLSEIPKEKHIFFAYGILIGLLTIPFGTYIGGLSLSLTNYPLGPWKAFLNLIPVIIIDVILGLLLFFFPYGSLRGFMRFGKFLDVLKVLGAALAIFQANTLIHIPLLDLMIDESKSGKNFLEDGLLTVGLIAVILTGVLPLIHFISTVFETPLKKLGEIVHLSSEDSTAIIGCLASIIPGCKLAPKMTDRGIVVFSSFMVCGAFVFGDHLAYFSTMRQDVIVPMIFAKLTGGILSLVLSHYVSSSFLKKFGESNEVNKLCPKDDLGEEEDITSNIQSTSNEKSN